MTIDELIQDLVHNVPGEVPEVGEKEQDIYVNPAFYTLIFNSLESFLEKLNLLDDLELAQKLRENYIFFKAAYTKKRFSNLLKRINGMSLEILKLCYNGSLINAGNDLCEMLGEKNPTLSKYLSEPYFNYFSFELSKGIPYYRMRDANADEEVKDCWHIPFQIRSGASTGRYSIAGFPSLYLADSLDVANEELGKLEKDNRWVSEFTVKEGKRIFLLDLSWPSIDKIKEMNDYKKLSFIVTYPIRLMCSIKTKKSGNPNNEEYFIPQLFCHALLIGDDKKVFCPYKGIIYNSTKIKTGKCIVMPAVEEQRKIQGYGHSAYLKGLWNVSEPHVYKSK